MCSDLGITKLNGSVPSSLSALTELVQLCVAPSLPTALARAADEGRISRLCSVRARATFSWVQCKGTVRALCVRRCTVERPSPLRVSSWLYNNKLTGSVPSSLSALTNLEELCVPPSCQRRLRVQPRRVGSVGSAPSARHVGGALHVLGHRAGAVRQQGRCWTLRGDLGHAM